MVRVLHALVFLFFTFSSGFISNAQSLKNPGQADNDISATESSFGIKPPSASFESVGIQKNSIQVISGDSNSSIRNETPSKLLNEKSQESIPLESIQFDYSQMPFDVQNKIDLNKATEKNLLDGIAKAFTVEINSCNTAESVKNTLSFLGDDNRFINSEFVSSGVVRINVVNSFDSVALKELMLEAGISFNFLNEYYFVKIK